MLRHASMVTLALMVLVGCDDERPAPGSDAGPAGADAGSCSPCPSDAGPGISLQDGGGGQSRQPYEPCDPGDMCGTFFTCADFMGTEMCTADCTADTDCMASGSICVPVGAGGQCAEDCVLGNPTGCRIGFACQMTARGSACLPN